MTKRRDENQERRTLEDKHRQKTERRAARLRQAWREHHPEEERDEQKRGRKP